MYLFEIIGMFLLFFGPMFATFFGLAGLLFFTGFDSIKRIIGSIFISLFVGMLTWMAIGLASDD